MGIFGGKPDIKKLIERRDVKGLIKALKYKDADVREFVALHLGEMRDARAVDPLIQAMEDETFGIRCLAATALGKIGDTKAMAPLLQALNDKNENVRINATSALGGIKDIGVVDPLVHTLEDKNWQIRLQAKKSLDNLSWKPRNDIEKVYYIIATPWDKWDELARLGKPVVEILIGALKDEYSLVQMNAAESLGEIGDARAVEPLIHALEGCYNVDVRKSVADALGKIGDTKATEPLIQALNDEIYDVWEVAKKALEKVQAEKSNKKTDDNEPLKKFRRGDKMGIFDKLRKKDKTQKVEEKNKAKIEVSLDIGELETLDVFWLPEELKERFGKVKKMLEQKVLENVGIEVGSKEFGDMIRLQTLVSSDPETATLIQNAKETYNRVYGIKVVLGFNKNEIKSIADCKASCGTSVDALRRKFSVALE